MTHPLRMRFSLPVAAALAAVLSAVPAATAAAPEAGPDQESGGAVPGQVIVRYEPGTSAAQRADARDDAGTRTIEGLGMARTQLLKVTDGGSVAATVRQLEAQPDVAYAEPNFVRRPAMLPNDPQFLNGNQWGLFNDGQTVNGDAGTPGADISATAAWNIELGDPGTVVAVVDTGADLQHPDLVNELWTNPGDGSHGYDFVDDDTDPTDGNGHGTHVSGIAAAEGNNSIGTTGVAQRASLMELKICDPVLVGTTTPHWSATCADSDLIDAIHYAANNGARVVNGSIAGGGTSQAVSDALGSHPGTLYVFAAGNDGEDNDIVSTYPCEADNAPGYSADNVICVAATDQSDDLASFSNYGAGSVDLGAPGVNIYSTYSEKTHFTENFESGDISASWTNTGGSTWAANGETPHIGSFAISDSPGGPYAPGTENEVVSNPVTLPPGYASCGISYQRAIALGAGDTFQITVTLDTSDPPDVTESRSFDLTTNTPGNQLQSGVFPLPGGFEQGGEMQVSLRLTSDATGQADGIHMDNIRIFCHGSPSDDGYEFMNGTSMAAPMVSGAAGLLFSDDPSMTATQVKEQLLDSVDSVPDLAGSTVSGGRLNVYEALNSTAGSPAGGGGGGGAAPPSGAPAPIPVTGTGSANSRPDTFFRRQPGRVVRTKKRRAKVVFRFGATEAGISYRCRLDRRKHKGADRRGHRRLERRRHARLDRSRYRRCGKRYVRRLRPGRYVLKVKAVDRDGAADSSAAVRRFRVKRVSAAGR
ncbi:MAG: S8 family serine peptidase [Solirubrobacterales bacterium]